MQEINGIIVINKPKNYTSHDVVAKVKKILNINKVGHTGTLDPNATGVLPLLLNQGTKLSKYLIEHDKEYEVVLKLGIKTKTADGEGEVVEEQKVEWDDIHNLEEIVLSFQGKQIQTPPIYSAIKVKGKKLYEYARNGQEVEIPSREIEIYEIKLQKVEKEKNEISFLVKCSKGTYIRSLCEDIAKKIGTIGYMKELNRTQVGKFTLQQAITLEELEEKKEETIQKNLITMEKFFENKPKIQLEKKKLELFQNGVKITIKGKDNIYQIYDENGNYIGTGVLESNQLKRDIIL